MKRIVWLLLAVPMFFSLSCSPDSTLGVLFDPPNCEITSLQKEDASPGQFAKFVITVKNGGSGATAYNVTCLVKLKNGNTIIDRGSAYFGSLNTGESAVAEAWFSNITSQDQYQSYDITLYWYDAQGGYYSN